MKKLTLLLCTLLLLSGCQSGPSTTEQREQLEAEVLELHDNAMAEMGKIYRLRRNMTRLQDTLHTQQPDTTQLQHLSQHITSLNTADEAMMQWMRQYKAPTEDQPHPEAMAYLQQELEKMTRVKQLMDSTITAAQQTYATYDPKK